MTKPSDPLTVPEGRRPEEFMNDEQLAAYYAAKLEGADDKDREKLAAAHKAAKVAAAITAAAGE